MSIITFFIISVLELLCFLSFYAWNTKPGDRYFDKIYYALMMTILINILATSMHSLVVSFSIK